MNWEELKIEIGDKAKTIISVDRGSAEGKLSCVCTDHAKGDVPMTWIQDGLKWYCHDCCGCWDIIDHCKWLSHDDMKQAYATLCEFAGVECVNATEDAVIPVIPAFPMNEEAEEVEYPAVELVEDTLRKIGGHFLTGRGISKQALMDYKVTSNKEAVFFNYYIGERVVKIKGRAIGEMPNGRDKYAPTPKGGSNVLYGQHLHVNQRVLAICEGEVDALSLHTALVANKMNEAILASSVPSGSSSMSWIENSKEFLKKFEAVVIIPDNDEAGKKFAEKAASELVMIVRVRTATLKKTGSNDVNELLQESGVKAVCGLIGSSADYLPDFTIDLGSLPEKVVYSDYERSGYYMLDKMLHGFIHGLITLFTGHTGAGKTTILRQMIIFNIQNKRRIGVMMGEETPNMFRDMILRQAFLKSDPNGFEVGMDEWNNQSWSPRSELIDKFKNEFSEYISSFNCGHLQDKGRLKKLYEWIKFEASIYGTRLFIIDNLMKLEVGMGDNLNSSQGDIIDALKNICAGLNVHIILVAHPKKGETSLNAESVSGSQKIANTVDNLVAFQRFDKMDEQMAGRIMSHLNRDNEYDQVTAFMKVQKNRIWATLGFIAMRYDEHSNCINDLDPSGNFRYGWTIPGRLFSV